MPRKRCNKRTINTGDENHTKIGACLSVFLPFVIVSSLYRFIRVWSLVAITACLQFMMHILTRTRKDFFCQYCKRLTFIYHECVLRGGPSYQWRTLVTKMTSKKYTLSETKKEGPSIGVELPDSRSTTSNYGLGIDCVTVTFTELFIKAIFVPIIHLSECSC